MHRHATDTQGLALRRSIRIAFALGLLGSAQLAFPQDDAADDEEIFELSPFEVTGDKNDGYRANSTLAGTRIRTDLKDVGSAISVYTEEFLEDIGATDSGSLLQYTTSGEVAGMNGTYSAAAGGSASDDSGALRNPITPNRIRGLGGADNTRDYFGTDIPWDSYMVDRVDVLRGANSMLFGLGSPAGIVNATLSDAAFENQGEAQLRFGSYGSLRTSLSMNKVLIEDELAIRVGVLKEDLGYQQEPAFENDTRFYTALRWEPKLFGDGASTTVRMKYENGDIESNNPRTTPPQDSISPWFRPLGRDDSNPYGGLGKTSISNLADAFELFGDEKAKYAWASTVAGAQTPFLSFDGATGQMYDAKAGFINNGAIDDEGKVQGAAAGVSGIRYSDQLIGINRLSGVALSGQYPFYEYGLYRSPNVMDPTLFNFYDTLIDGDNKREFSNWDALNLDLSQTWLNNRVGVNLTLDKQDFLRGGDSLMGWGPTINVDITHTFQDGTSNPNFGRPFVSTSGGNGSSYASSRESKRVSAFGELRATDFVESDSFLAKLLGKHLFNAVGTEEDYQYENRSWNRKVASQAWQGYWNLSDGASVPIADRSPNAIIYLGDSVASRSSAAGANIPGIQSQIDWQDFPVQLFDAIWTPQGGVAWDDPWPEGATYYMTDPLYSQEAPEDGWLQRSNPANYKGWNRDTTVGVRSYDMGANTDLLTRAQMNQREISSQAANWQGFFWNDSVVATFGWRKDEVKSRAVSANDRGTRQAGILNLDPNADIPSPYRLSPYTEGDVFKDETISKGLVVHLNKIMPDALPIDVSLTYNKSSNFQVAEVRRDVYGNAISNPSGDTEDYGVTLATKDGKYSLRAIKYESSSNNASANLNGTGNIGSAIANGLAWRNVFLYDLGGYDWASRDQPNYRNTLSNAYSTWNGQSLFKTVDGEEVVDEAYQLQLEDQMIGQWNEIQGWLDERGFFEAWNFSPVPLQYLTTRSVYEASLDDSAPPRTPASQYIPPADSIGTYGTQTAPSGFAVTGDVVAKGYEFELVANPTDNLRISFNASKSEVINSNIGGESLTELVDYLDARINANTLAGAQPRWGNAGGAVHLTWSNFMSGYKLMKLQEGTASPELRKWRYSFVGNYSFNEGKLKGLGIGASYRWQDKVAIGYPLVPIDSNNYTYDVTNPVFGPSEDFIDLWASYKRKLNDRIDWKIQLNVKNVGAGDDLIPIAIQPYIPGETDLQIASARIAPAQQWFITNTFSF